MRRAALVYTLGRFGLFFVLAVLTWAVSGLLGHQLNGLPLLLLAALLSSGLGYVVFAPQRRQLAQAIEAQRGTRAQQVAERRARLDEET